MKNKKLIAGIMLSGMLLGTTATVLADSSNAMQNQSSKVKETSNTSSSSSITVDKNKAENAEVKNDPIQTLKEQKMIIKKIIAKGGSKIATVSESKETESSSNTANSSTSTSLSSSSSNASSTSTSSITASSTSTNNSTSSSSQEPGIDQSELKGVPNSKFVVYDVTDLMDSIIKEKLGVDDKKADAAIKEAAKKEDDKAKETQETSSQAKTTVSNKDHENSVAKADSEIKASSSSVSSKESNLSSKESETSESNKESTKDDQDLIKKVEELRKGDTLRKEISERAAKLNKDQLKLIAEVTTNENGEAETKIPIDSKYHAYYVVNTQTAKESHATNSAPIVVITPVTDSKGMYAPEFTIYPKADVVEESQVKMYQTGSQTFLDKIVEWFANLVK